MPKRDRYLRFGYAASDEQVERYVKALDFQRDQLFGVFDRALSVVAFAHLAYGPNEGSIGPQTAEFGISVVPHLRGLGVGTRLFNHAMLHARNRRVATLYIHALSENKAMLKIARSAGATVVRDGAESAASIKLAPDTMASRLGVAVKETAAEIDYRLKRQGRLLRRCLDFVDEVRAGMRKTAE